MLEDLQFYLDFHLLNTKGCVHEISKEYQRVENKDDQGAISIMCKYILGIVCNDRPKLV